MRVATWNIWNVQGEPMRWQRDVPSVLKACDADVLLLQEISPEPSGVPQSSRFAQILDMASERYFFAGLWRGREEGAAILTRFPMVQHMQHVLPDGADGMGRIVCGATLATPSGEVDVYTTHLSFPLSDSAGRYAQALDALAFMERANSRRPTIFGGDLNDVPDSSAAQVFSGGSGFTDVCAKLPPEARRTFLGANPLVQSELGPDRCIDYLFHTPHWTASSVELFGQDLDGAFASDHLGIRATLERTP